MKQRRAKLKWIILVNEKGDFWSGRRWVSEYPDARKYRTTKQAGGVRALILARGGVNRVTMWANYGEADQREVE